jgi:FkbM family methyltransferase
LEALLVIQKLFTTAVKPLVGSGIGRIKPLANLYQRMSKTIMPNNKIIDVQGFKFKAITESGISDISTELLYRGIHEPMSTEIFKRYVQEGNCIVDIGANCGYFTLLSARLVGQKGMVYAFEPSNDNIKDLLVNVELNHFKNVVIKEMAISDYTGRSKFYLSSRESALHSLIETKVHDLYTMVDVGKLDDVLPQNAIVHLLKTDTEGNELAVLKGAKETIKRNFGIKILVEVNPDALHADNVGIVNLWNYLTNDLFIPFIWLVDDHKREIKSTTLNKLLKYWHTTKKGCNLLCSRERLAIDKLGKGVVR